MDYAYLTTLRLIFQGQKHKLFALTEKSKNAILKFTGFHR